MSVPGYSTGISKTTRRICLYPRIRQTDTEVTEDSDRRTTEQAGIGISRSSVFNLHPQPAHAMPPAVEITFERISSVPYRRPIIIRQVDVGREGEVIGYKASCLIIISRIDRFAVTITDRLIAIHLLRKVGKLFDGSYLDGIRPGGTVAARRVFQTIHACQMVFPVGRSGWVILPCRHRGKEAEEEQGRHEAGSEGLRCCCFHTYYNVNELF